MKVEDAIKTRRAYRSLDSVNITEELIRDLGTSAKLSPSCFNNQPWRYIFVYDRKKLNELQEAMSENNKWTQRASLIVAVYSHQEDDCNIGERHYYLFDTGMATAFLILRATELGLVAHPIAGFKEKKAKDILKIPERMRLITLVIIGKHSEEFNNLMTENQKSNEKKRPKRKELAEFISIDNSENKFY
jgi:nitroreductase